MTKLKLVVNNECDLCVTPETLTERCLKCPTLDQCFTQWLHVKIEETLDEGDSDFGGKAFSNQIARIKNIISDAKELLARISKQRPV